jgi:hypothetical protein
MMVADLLQQPRSGGLFGFRFSAFLRPSDFTAAASPFQKVGDFSAALLVPGLGPFLLLSQAKPCTFPGHVIAGNQH